MLTDDKSISTKKYWDDLYAGKRNDAKVDASNTKRTSTFDRFQIVADLVDGPNVLEACAGHARIAERVKAAHPKWHVVVSDQSEEARNVSTFRPYDIFSVYDMPCINKYFDTIIVCQSFEYVEDLPKAMLEIQRVGNYLVTTLPVNEMKSWSQLYIFNPEMMKTFFSQYGKIEVFKDYGDIMLFKIKLNA